jgi:hypothetical protein
MDRFFRQCVVIRISKQSVMDKGGKGGQRADIEALFAE